MVSRQLSILILFFLMQAGYAGDLTFKHLTTEDGLSQNTINCIFQDHFGLMWFGTQDGLNYYDGYEIKVFRHDPSDNLSLSHSWIWDIEEDDSLNLWIATWNGLSKYDRRQGIFTRYLPDSTNRDAISGSRPASIVKDDDGRLWIGTWGGGLNLFLPAEDKFLSFRNSVNPDRGYPGDLIRTLFIDDSGILWIGTWEGLFSCTPSETGPSGLNHFSHDPDDVNSISNNRVTAISQEPDGTIWIGTLGGGVNRLDRKSGIFTRFRNDPGNNSSISGNDITSITTDLNGVLWIGTVSSGLNSLNKRDLTFNNYRNDADNRNSLLADGVYSLFCDESGLLWIGAGGLNLLDPHLSKFTYSSGLEILIESMTGKSIDVIYEDSQECIWIGTQASGLYMFDPGQKVQALKSYKANGTSRISHNDVSSIAEDRAGNIWISTRGGGLNKIDRRTGKILIFNEEANNPATAGMNYINSLMFANNDVLWIATSDNGLIRFNIKSGEYRKYLADPADPGSLSGNYLLRLFKDSQGNIWITTWGAGINRHNAINDNFTRFLNDPEDSRSLPGNIVHCIYENPENRGKLWFGTANGLAAFNTDQPDSGFFALPINGQLPSRSIYGIIKNRNNDLWISTSSGLIKYHEPDKTLKIYTSRDGLPGNEFNASAYITLRSGYYAFGSTGGLLVFHPDSIIQSTYNPGILFTSFSVYNRQIINGIRLNTLRTISLNHDQNFFSFEFASSDFSLPENNLFKYKLEGIDEDWVNSAGRHYASYTNIDPGHYRFVVMGTNRDGTWSDRIASINLVIKPPFWQKWWFRSLVILLALTILYGLHLYRLNRVREIERLRIRIASDLHDDVGSALTRISIHSQQIAGNRDRDLIATSSDRISELSRQVISTMSDIVWSIDARNDRITDLIDRMKDFAYNTLSEKEIRVTFEDDGLEGKKKLPVLIRQNLYYIFKEAINNIVKHSGADDVIIRMLNRDQSFNMTIADNGSGYDEESIRKGNGIRNMNLRANRIGAKIEFRTDNGVEITLSMKSI